MEPKLIRKDIKYQGKTLIIVSVLVISLFIGGSFALLSSSSETEEVVTFKTGDFNLEVKTTGTLSLEGEAPKSYDDGFKNNDITLTLTNTGSLEIGKYDVKLEGDSTSTLEANYIRYSVSDDGGKTYLASKLLSDTNNIIYTGYNLKDNKELKLKIWIDRGAGANALKKSYNGKINVILYQEEDTLVDVVKSKLVSNYSGRNESFPGGLVAVNTNGDLYHEVNNEQIREYRYSGLNVNNYVTFNEETWRIVGVFKDENGEEHVKIVRNEYLNGIYPENYAINGTSYIIKGTETLYAYWNNKVEGKINSDWATAGLQYFLNTEYDDNMNNGYLSYLKEDAKKMIEETTYYLGAITFTPNENIDTVKEAYINERKVEGCTDGIGLSSNNNQSAIESNETCRVWAGHKAIWAGKIGLLYLSDYGYSITATYWNDNLLSLGLDKTWIDTTSGWLLSSNTFRLTSISEMLRNGVSHRDANYYGELVLPTLYLKSDIKITSGDGTSVNPYKLSGN